MLIKLKKLNSDPILINPDTIESVAPCHHSDWTKIYCSQGLSYEVRETVEEIYQMIETKKGEIK